MSTPTPVLPEMRLPALAVAWPRTLPAPGVMTPVAPAVAPPIRLPAAPAAMETPKLFASDVKPKMSVPMKLPCTTLPVPPVSAPRMATPLSPLAEMRLPAPATVPPMVLFEALSVKSRE